MKKEFSSGQDNTPSNRGLNLLSELSDTKSVVNPTQEQIITANVRFYLKVLGVFDKAAKDIASGGTIKRGINTSWETHPNKSEAKASLVDLYFARESRDDTAIEQFRNNWGKETYIFERVIEENSSEIERLRTEAFSKVENISFFDIAKTRFKAGRFLARVTDKDKSRLLEAMGYSQEESERLKSKILTSLKLTGKVEGAKEIVSVIGGIVLGGMITNYLGGVSPGEAIVVGNTIYYTSALLPAVANLRLLKEDINCPNVFSTSGYEATRKLPKPIHYMSTVISSYGTEGPKELLWNLPSLIPGKLLFLEGPSFFLGACVTSSVLNTLQFLGSEIYLKMKDHKKDQAN